MELYPENVMFPIEQTLEMPKIRDCTMGSIAMSKPILFKEKLRYETFGEEGSQKGKKNDQYSAELT